MQQDEQKKDEKYEEELNFDNPDYVFLPKGTHHYRQQGYYLVCTSCDLRHATYIGRNKVMVGEKDGQPIIKTRKELGMV